MRIEAAPDRAKHMLLDLDDEVGFGAQRLERDDLTGHPNVPQVDVLGTHADVEPRRKRARRARQTKRPGHDGWGVAVHVPWKNVDSRPPEKRGHERACRAP